MLEKTFGSDNPHVGSILGNLVMVNVALGQKHSALECGLRENTIKERLVEQVFSFSSEKERFTFMRTLNANRNAFLTLCAEHLGSEGAKAGLKFLLRRKGIVLDSLVEEAEATRLSGDADLKERVTRVRETKSRLASLTLAGPGEEGPEQYQATIHKLQSHAEEIEKDLARQSARFRTLRTGQKVGMPEVTAALPTNSALVEFAKYKSFNFSATGTVSRWGTERYIAYVLREDESTPVLVKLGEAEAIERLITGYRTAIQGFVQKTTKVADVNAASESLEKVVWAPVKAALGQARRVYLSPDGELNFVSFAGLRDQNGRYALEDYDLAYVSSGRDLAREGFEGGKLRRRMALFGAPDFGGVATDTGQEMLTRAGSFHSELDGVRSFRGMRFDLLPATRVEIIGIEALALGKGLEAETYLGVAASEARVKATEQPRILHFATHGFFLPGSGWAEQTRSGHDMELGRLGRMSLGASTVEWSRWKLENPMHRSGLALAGANLTLEGKTKLGEEDGILTAEEVAGLDLAGTELVVLSACETGLGEAKGGEGVLGLRRAFVRAGAQNLVMSLWQVSDRGTQELMKTMYEKYFGGQPVWKALLDTQRDALAVERKAGREPNPYLWAGFVASGVGVQ